MPVFSRLELKNFKGYRDEVVIEWRQLSSIVGLNGVGKSTIPDAIEYVFCFPTYNTKRKSFLLFRKDISNSEYLDSEDCPSTVVKATLRHEEQEITFERSTDYYENVHRYLVNDEEVTVKEYKKRLLECNLNSDANNFLVKQNSIEGIAMMNAKERCELFERACNSIAYKTEYTRLKSELNEALQKVEISKKHMNKFSVQLKKLEKLSKSTKKYEKLQAELVNVDFEYYFANLLKIDRELDRTRKHKEEVSMNIRAAEKVKKSYEDKIVELKSSLDNEEGEAKLRKLQQKLSGYSLKSVEQENLLLAQKKKINAIASNLETAKKDDAAREKTIKDLEQQLAEVKQQKDEVDRLESLSSSIQLDDEQYEEYLRLKSESIMLFVKEGELKDSIQRERDNINDKIKAYRCKEKSLTDQIKIENSKAEALQRDIAQILKHCDSTNSDIEKYSRELLDLEFDIENSKSQLESLNQDINDLNAKIGESKSSFEWKRKTQRKHEIIYKLKCRFSGVYGRLSNFFEISDKRYNVAITKIVGSKVDYILVDNDDTARRCVYFLKEQYAGSPFNVIETFMPLDNIKVSDPQYVLAAIKDDPTVALAKSLVWTTDEATECDVEKIERALENVMGNVIVCDDEETALNYSRKKRIECVSLNGTLYKKDGVFSGGLASLLEKSKVWSEKEVENLKNEKEIKVQEMRKLGYEIRNKIEKKNEIEIKLSGLQSQLINCLQPSLVIQQNKLIDVQNKLSVLEKELSDLKDTSNIEELLLELKKIENKLTIIKKKIEAKENEYFATFCQKLNIDNIQQYEKGDFKKYKQRCEHKKQIYDHYCNIENLLNLEMSRLAESEVKKLEVQLEAVEKIYSHTKENKAKLNAKVAETNNLIESLKQKLAVEQKRKELTIKERELKAVNNDLRNWNSYISSDDVKIMRLEAKKHDILMNCVEKNVDIPLRNSTIEKVVMNTKAVINTETETSNTNESESDSQIQEKFVEIDYSKLPKSVKKLEKGHLISYIKTLQKKQNDISEQIESIDIRPKMKEQFELLKDKVKELDGKHKKLLKKATEIKTKFDEIKNQRAETFKSFFNSVADNIDRIFKDLYGNEGAQALIHLKSEEEPYLDGIDFQCIIPEKKFGLLKDFSGGEKTMSAIALLLAIYNAKPTSFLIFDEIDAALDNNNIARIVKYFVQLKPITQIISISHQHQLSVFADAIIGVNFSPQRNTSYVVHIDLTVYQKNIQPNKCLAVAAEERIAALS